MLRSSSKRCLSEQERAGGFKLGLPAELSESYGERLQSLKIFSMAPERWNGKDVDAGELGCVPTGPLSEGFHVRVGSTAEGRVKVTIGAMSRVVRLLQKPGDVDCGGSQCWRTSRHRMLRCPENL